MVGAEDFTTLAGSIGSTGNAKRYRLAELAVRDKIPLVMLLEGAGFRPTGAHYGRTPTDLIAQAQCSGRVPTVAAVLGPSAGHGALVAPVSDFRIMSSQGAIFTAGPPVVKESTGEDISQEDLGGPGVALHSGVIHNHADTDEAVIDDIRRYLSYFPSSAWSYPGQLPHDEDAEPRPTPELLDIISRDNRRVYNMRSVLDIVFDNTDWFEVQPQFGKAIICALAHLGGHPVAVVANQPQACWPARSTPTPPTRQRISSWWPTPSTCRSCSSPTTRACCRAAARSAPVCCGPGRGCSRRRRPPPRSNCM